jgi:hypothetical protein
VIRFRRAQTPGGSWIGRVAPAALAVAMLAGCGQSGGPKHAVDPRTEVLRFFPADARAVALINTDAQIRDLRALARTASPVPGFASLRRTASRIVAASGLSLRRQIAPLLGNELAIGTGASGHALASLETEDPAGLDAVLAYASRHGGVEPAGRYRHARLFTAHGAALASRDGVLLAASDTPELRRALDVRDGPGDGRLDDHEVKGVLGDLPDQAGVHVWADLGSALDQRLGQRATRRADRLAWPAALGQGGVSFELRHDSATLAFLARTDRADVSDDDLPIAPGETAPPLHRVAAGFDAGLRDPGRTQRFSRRLETAVGNRLPAARRLVGFVARLGRGGAAVTARVPGASGSLAFTGRLRSGVGLLAPRGASPARVPRIVRISGYLSASTDELLGRIEFTR